MRNLESRFLSIDTPAILIDMDKLEENISTMSSEAREAGIGLRPHVKVHECAFIAKKQIEEGAIGIEVGAIAQAVAMTEQGITDIVIAHPGFYGGLKGASLKRILKNPRIKVTLVVDMLEQVEILSRIAKSTGRDIPVLIKIDLGRLSRFGIQPGKPVIDFAHRLSKYAGIYFTGIYGHEMGTDSTQESKDRIAFEAGKIMSDLAVSLRNHGFKVEHVSLGASSTFRSTCRFIKEGKLDDITEIHPGQCVVGDIHYMKMGGNAKENIAISVLSTVMSTSHSDWAMIDAGYKTFGADAMISHVHDEGFLWQGKPSFGVVRGRPDLWFGRLSAETGSIYYMDSKKKLQLGERLEIVPNNATLIINIHDVIYGVRENAVEKVISVTGRGRGS